MKEGTVRIILWVTFLAGSLGRAQSSQGSPELFREYFSITTPLFKAVIPADTCRTLIAQADGVVSGGGLKTQRAKKDLQIGSNNLRVCATTDSLDRMERDLAVGLHAEFVSELERRESGRND